jgi:hypothetical protein
MLQTIHQAWFDEVLKVFFGENAKTACPHRRMQNKQFRMDVVY